MECSLASLHSWTHLNWRRMRTLIWISLTCSISCQSWWRKSLWLLRFCLRKYDSTPSCEHCCLSELSILMYTLSPKLFIWHYKFQCIKVVKLPPIWKTFYSFLQAVIHCLYGKLCPKALIIPLLGPWGTFTAVCRSLCSRNGPWTLQWEPELLGNMLSSCICIRLLRNILQSAKMCLSLSSSGFVFLRLICPAILNPRMFNIIAGECTASQAFIFRCSTFRSSTDAETSVSFCICKSLSHLTDRMCCFNMSFFKHV